MIAAITSFMASNIRTTTPLLLAGLGVVFSERAGVVNIGVEGTMLIGAFTGVVVSYYSGSALVGGLAATPTGKRWRKEILGDTHGEHTNSETKP